MNYQKNNNSYFNPVNIIKSNDWIKETKQILNREKKKNPIIINSRCYKFLALLPNHHCNSEL